MKTESGGNLFGPDRRSASHGDGPRGFGSVIAAPRAGGGAAKETACGSMRSSSTVSSNVRLATGLAPVTERPTHHQLFHATAAVDAGGVVAAPAAILVADGRITAVGSPESIGAIDGVEPERLDDDEVISPAFVNAHSHLDLTHLGCAVDDGDDRADLAASGHGPGECGDRPRDEARSSGRSSGRSGDLGGAPTTMPPQRKFTEWAGRIRAGRLTAPAEISASVHLGVALSIAGGVAAVGDISGARSLVPVEELRRSPLRGVSFVEVFGQGRRQEATIEFMEHLLDVTVADEDGVRVGLQPHAPYSCGPRVYAAAAALGRRLGLPLSTHLAETLDELEFVRHGRGAFADLLRQIGVWDETIVGLRAHPIDALQSSLATGHWIVAHANHIESHHLGLLARLDVTVAFCPRAHRYFGHDVDPQRPHRWEEMLAAGIPVALATDSLPCLDSPDRLTPLDDARFLHALQEQRGGPTTPEVLLAAITTTPAAALGLDPDDFRLRAGAGGGLLAVRSDSGSVSSAAAPLQGSGDLRWLTGPWMQHG